MSNENKGLLPSELASTMENRKLAQRFKEENSVLDKISITSKKYVDNVVMGNKRKVDVLIDGVVYTLVSSEDESYMQRVAFYLNQKIAEIKRVESSKNLDTRAIALLTSMNVVDDYFKTLQENKEFDIKIQSLKSEIDIYKNEYKMINKENELLKAAIENLKMQLLKSENAKH